MLNAVEIETLRKRVKIMLTQIKKSEIVKHFEMEGFARRTIYNTLNRLESGGDIKNKKKTGRPTSLTAARRSRLKKLTNHRKGVSQRRLARKFEVSQSTICRQLKKIKISCRKREKTPKYTEKQQQKAKILCSKLSNFLHRNKVSLILDDEKYFTFSGSNMPGNDNYYTNDIQKCPDDIRFVGKEKFPKKVLVWIAISEHGISRPVIRPSKSESIKSNLYINECLQKKLLPFIKKYHSNVNYVFWPDLASSHYSKQTVAWMSENVNFVPKNLNPPNVPQARPIENFWGCLAQKVYEGDWGAKTEQQLISRIESKIKEFDLKFVQSLLKGVKAKIKKIGQHGVHSLNK